MSMGTKGDGNFLGGIQSKNDDGRGEVNKRGKYPQYVENGYDDSGSGPMYHVRRLQQRFANSCCSSVESLSPVAFLGLIVLFICLLGLLISGITVWAASRPQMSLRGSASDDEDYYDDDGFNLTVDADSLFDLFTEKRPMSGFLHVCREHGFLCRNEFKRIGHLQRCDGQADCLDASDEAGCTDCNTAFKCPITSPSGETIYRCLRGDKLCDGVSDCDGGEDENHCADRECKASEYRCHNTKKCIPKSYKCDGDSHCLYHDDESECAGQCQNDAVWCPSSGRCIPKWKRCDGTWDCQYGEDEKDCSCKECCGSNRLLCGGTKQCISRSKVCDGKHDCADGADEENCPGICKKSALKLIDTVVCADGRRYNKRLACSGMLKICEFSCKKCNEVYAISCRQGGMLKCLSKAEVCDGKYDCEDHSDEANCTDEQGRRCIRNGFSLRPKWLKEDQICDGVYDCMDKEDEQNCNRCRNNGIYCFESRRCITEFERCNGVIDCLDGSDEVGCTCEDCAYRYPPMFKCANSDQCVKYEEACTTCRNLTSREKAFCKFRISLK